MCAGMLAVDHAYRRQGLAALLISLTIDAMVVTRTPVLTLEALATNEAAMALYRRVGFVSAAKLRSYYSDGSDAIRLVKPVLIATTSAGSVLRHGRRGVLPSAATAESGSPTGREGPLFDRLALLPRFIHVGEPVRPSGGGGGSRVADPADERRPAETAQPSQHLRAKEESEEQEKRDGAAVAALGCLSSGCRRVSGESPCVWSVAEPWEPAVGATEESPAVPLLLQQFVNAAVGRLKNREKLHPAAAEAFRLQPLYRQLLSSALLSRPTPSQQQ
eukprot:GHVU01143836.1.p1 GENE.GHVU01143836.1~~GHVU01143836.1.p1  ORF type:complete len:275 (+),score=53.26 GHVU01143836.1:177-1001(+)